jgi:hypothetical protein
MADHPVNYKPCVQPSCCAGILNGKQAAVKHHHLIDRRLAEDSREETRQFHPLDKGMALVHVLTEIVRRIIYCFAKVEYGAGLAAENQDNGLCLCAGQR